MNVNLDSVERTLHFIWMRENKLSLAFLYTRVQILGTENVTRSSKMSLQLLISSPLWMQWLGRKQQHVQLELRSSFASASYHFQYWREVSLLSRHFLQANYVPAVNLLSTCTIHTIIIITLLNCLSLLNKQIPDDTFPKVFPTTIPQSLWQKCFVQKISGTERNIRCSIYSKHFIIVNCSKRETNYLFRW